MTKTTDEIVIDENGRILNDPTHAEPIGHGNTPAGWALVLFMLVGCVVAGVGMLMSSMITIYVGVGLAVLGCILGFILRAAGKGTKGNSGH